ncbi:nuclear cap-binding protein subunit 3 [Agrilus planipennis]|uniref:Nuclear cap-binding protein subunit 3 n=1 Tax=Agrilus planipennis TaxID=224129 RepID=A0A1W4XTM4_AGRPL|nr:nuclear cap-binding protein subunit 3 [Agrilus planipennis]
METIRPNIRIEIPNNVNEAMDIDNQESGENEEGEIQDSVDMNQCLESFDDFQTKIIPVNQTKVWMNEAGGFSTGIDILNKGTNERLEERAKRFGLKPNEIQNFTEENLQVLQDSLGVSYKNEKEIRFEAIHMRGTDDLSTEDIFEYFKKYGPSYIEWISDDSCNVVWEDKLSSARALYFTSKAIQGMPVEGPCNPFVKELEIAETEEDENRGHSILLQNREIELQKEDNDDKENSTKYIHILDIKIPIPPGYWRLGLDHPKSKGILMRFSFRSDKKPFKVEKK